ncbi:hypothetical protein COCSUDRAFT_34587 [Coccomyxa subellipsoidea C-169]|uniref:Uncharacterized protein n=1 Tax=Coccomyxa subellipsoidea (strain C-169) TaxID=574566 RepID=I0YIQ2_COCSC|nr:hypothetical protein COCSUDRAFT_34587 [Coccomyxa subellipsoidea C-169]EIE18271.1 hypothetical protein COCSUDRAFT_34587 [Coccomyxa subellipsoidea C-169]|eukprot:XP_005642815.1 hypothetical protein COCSUDRAFT_34587 [Coccomyxa subellipsoidea C-169]
MGPYGAWEQCKGGSGVLWRAGLFWHAFVMHPGFTRDGVREAVEQDTWCEAECGSPLCFCSPFVTGARANKSLVFEVSDVAKVWGSIFDGPMRL